MTNVIIMDSPHSCICWYYCQVGQSVLVKHPGQNQLPHFERFCSELTLACAYCVRSEVSLVEMQCYQC